MCMGSFRLKKKKKRNSPMVGHPARALQLAMAHHRAYKKTDDEIEPSQSQLSELERVKTNTSPISIFCISLTLFTIS
ncbi:hypothetical protein RJT34_09807 [Clitoria ternatea]|uniref:Uncharacterized protein n=1 Tax=Clitoria ternatea TaxID=43366 RepID=A0AAN9K7B1_CLITE